MRFINFFILSLKRHFKKPAFVLLLGVLMVFSLFIGKITDVSKLKIDIGLVSKTMPNDVGAINFIKYDNEIDLKKAVSNYEIDSGFVISEEFIDNVFYDEKIKILTVKRNDSNFHLLGKEILYAEFVDIYGIRMLEKAIEETFITTNNLNIERIDQIAKTYVDRKMTYHFEYQWLDNGKTIATTYSFPFKYIAINLILVLLFMSLKMVISDIKSGIYKRFTLIDTSIYISISILSSIIVFLFVYLIIFKIIF